MLVVSRKKTQQILFPNLGIAIEILRISGNAVSVGINAPESVEILRGELLRSHTDKDGPPVSAEGVRELHHALRNQLNKAQLTVAIAQKQLELGRSEDAERTLNDMLKRLTQIDQQTTDSVSDPLQPYTHAATVQSDKPRHALLVEDDPNERALLAGYLRLCGFKVSEAGDGMEAMEFLETNPVDLVVLDMRMPRMNGLDVVQAVRRHPVIRQTKVVIVSGEDRDESFLTSSECRISEWFSKPLDPNRLVEYLNRSPK
jgi:carbon storage regulator CsrA